MASIACLTIAVSKSGSSYVKAKPTLDPLLERHPTGSKAAEARPQLPTCGYPWRRASEIRAEKEFMGSCPGTNRSWSFNCPCELSCKLSCLLAGEYNGS